MDRCVLGCLLCTWCCQYLLHLSYVFLHVCILCAPGAVFVLAVCTVGAWHVHDAGGERPL